jgi:hypothetical protein
MNTIEQLKKIFKFNSLIRYISRVEIDKEWVKVWLTFPNENYYKGFSNDSKATLHGGITRKLFDVMTVATAFILGGYQGPTCQGNWKLRKPLLLEKEFCLKGSIEKIKLGFVWIKLKITQEGLVYAEAIEALKIVNS